jgi:hypothetical protein
MLAGCPHRVVEYGPEGAPTSAEDVLRRVAAAETSVVGVKGDARLYVEAPQGKGAVGLYLAAQLPSLIHLEQLDFFNRPQGVLVTDGTTVGLYDAQDARYFRGPASPTNLGRFLPLVMPPAELAGLLLGRAPRIHADTSRFSFDPQTGLFVVELQQGGVVQTIKVAPPSYRVVESTVVGLPAYDLRYEELSNLGGTTFPRKLTLDAKLAHTHLELTFKDITLNEAPDLTLFDLSPPDNVPVVEVDARGQPLDAGTP